MRGNFPREASKCNKVFFYLFFIFRIFEGGLSFLLNLHSRNKIRSFRSIFHWKLDASLFYLLLVGVLLLLCVCEMWILLWWCECVSASVGNPKHCLHHLENPLAEYHTQDQDQESQIQIGRGQGIGIGIGSRDLSWGEARRRSSRWRTETSGWKIGIRIAGSQPL